MHADEYQCVTKKKKRTINAAAQKFAVKIQITTPDQAYRGFNLLPKTLGLNCLLANLLHSVKNARNANIK